MVETGQLLFSENSTVFLKLPAVRKPHSAASGRSFLKSWSVVQAMSITKRQRVSVDETIAGEPPIPPGTGVLPGAGWNDATRHVDAAGASGGDQSVTSDSTYSSGAVGRLCPYREEASALVWGAWPQRHRASWKNRPGFWDGACIAFYPEIRPIYSVDVIYGSVYILQNEYIPVNALPRHRARYTPALSAFTP